MRLPLARPWPKGRKWVLPTCVNEARADRHYPPGTRPLGPGRPPRYPRGGLPRRPLRLSRGGLTPAEAYYLWLLRLATANGRLLFAGGRPVPSVEAYFAWLSGRRQARAHIVSRPQTAAYLTWLHAYRQGRVALVRTPPLPGPATRGGRLPQLPSAEGGGLPPEPRCPSPPMTPEKQRQGP